MIGDSVGREVLRVAVSHSRFDRLSIVSFVDIIAPEQCAQVLNGSQRQHDNASKGAHNKDRFQDSHRDNQHENSASALERAGLVRLEAVHQKVHKEGVKTSNILPSSSRVQGFYNPGAIGWGRGTARSPHLSTGAWRVPAGSDNRAVAEKLTSPTLSRA
jgi:hypothetical protein